MTGTPIRVTVAMLTYRRPEDLRVALPQILAQVIEVPDAELLVVDNDTVASARDVVVEQAAVGAPVRYVHEPHPGIVAGRNKALDEALGDIIVFIDDDERPAEHWLATMLAAHERFGGAGVVGPVLAEFDGDLDPWIASGRFFERRRFTTGTIVPIAATGNILFDMGPIRSWGLRFDSAFHQSGGSDTAFTRELSSLGGRLYWCDEAPVIDVVPVARATRSWVLRRAFRVGNSRVRVELHQAPSRTQSLPTRGRWVAHGAARIVAGSGRVVAGSVVRSAGHQARGARTVARGAGMLAGAFGSVYLEYRR